MTDPVECPSCGNRILNPAANCVRCGWHFGLDDNGGT